MKKEKSKFLDILFGILTAIGVYVAGFLMAGRLAFAEDIELYETGYAVLVFPFLFAIICILVELFSANKNRPVYFKASMICFALPVIFLIMVWCLESLRYHFDDSGLLYEIFGCLVVYSGIFWAPLLSIFEQIYDILNEHTILSILFMAVPMLLCYIFAIVKFKKDRSKQNKSTE